MESNIPFTNNNKGNLIQPNQAKATTSMLQKKKYSILHAQNASMIEEAESPFHN